ncbi:2-oxo-hepta-3-ene-1,7-dioic acid hydratase [Achromobacter xylosoxidans]|jgi:2-oxo-hept-3-ene-1,7-dioate hydratase|uniref:2-oxo-hept-4-ene-1,7-dioate hydratase n=1 Tax=Alcaligenes xylosoxydans xylosoxydans TaxID=85698 RepID=UPI0006AC947D|nr:2-oxo-hepta-3-ene-1,7-dioic acid hydratase [Achromobacter xylosoxidans]KOQ21920.1 2-oxo-hepta-3-ene-1,7-dioate hydratase [Achromobacter xylosoxidans]KOQ26641.1 2-oxo-hepta-3-ene-1,7-dioate hydratase [Achromobacter xylosoxidans]KOQ27112.1 2-oxo-hepta-3-ene-1,7-dioate hydratase [Achromobacter xylosoxidans]KOQ38604.1 2-oxo-hepta-3-ene-1,7-dioate hydratase [Achromobacter xylosoxidans]KOQ49297.1 2-oxo-hepta-3-ene-1,7-dioate hydratase [Achromobacter xylosoxidans]
MLNDAQRQQAAALLIEAERTGMPTTQLDQAFPGIEIADAYAIQQRIIASKLAAGARLRGHKIGLTSKAMQSTVGIDEPDYGHLLDTMFFQDGDTIATEKLIVPRVEVELAFVLGKPLRGPDVTLFDVLDATDYVVPALELIDGRSKYPRRIVDNIADNAACAGIILGGRPVKPLDVDLRWVAALLLKNGVIEESGVSAAVLGHPAMGIVWLANKLAAHDTGLEAGQIVLAGSFTRTVAVAKGDTIHADYGPLGSISVHFS